MAVEKKGDEIITKTEFKGLDIVRRDWSNLARTVSFMLRTADFERNFFT